MPKVKAVFQSYVMSYLAACQQISLAKVKGVAGQKSTVCIVRKAWCEPSPINYRGQFIMESTTSYSELSICLLQYHLTVHKLYKADIDLIQKHKKEYEQIFLGNQTAFKHYNFRFQWWSFFHDPVPNKAIVSICF